jgi:uracil-DNA glycosylase
MSQDFIDGRGNPWDYDPGPPANRLWARIFAETPNYRGLGRALGGTEEFRWHFGPIFYRGRLTDGRAKVLVVGQEGAQDESLGHRAFVGGTGARMQHFLNALGITESYLFVNTFTYPIFGQYNGGALVRLAQHEASPIVQHRHALFDYTVARNDLRLIVAVGRAAKESVHTWVVSRGGTCPSGAHDVGRCRASALGPRTRIVGVVHPGAGGKGASTATILADFKKALRQIELWRADDPAWLPVDPGGTRTPAAEYRYRSAPIPFRDLPFGTSWRVGQGGTSSNRKDAQRAIQMFSEDGRYSASPSYASDARGSREGYAQQTGDVPYEPPKREFADFDSGPAAGLARLLMGGEPGLEWPDFSTLGVTSHPSFGHGSIYRGRPARARVLVLADQESHDDLFTGRALTGDGGQRFQEFLRAMGITTSYCVLRVLPVDTLDLPASRVRTIVDHPQIQKVYRAIVQRILDAGETALALVVGPHARRLADAVLPNSVRRIDLKSWREGGAEADWNARLQQLQSITYTKDAPASFSYDGKRGQIPRIDLPYGTLRWQGTSGDRAVRAGGSSPDYYKILMPSWAFGLAPEPLSAAEQDAIDLLR